MISAVFIGLMLVDSVNLTVSRRCCCVAVGGIHVVSFLPTLGNKNKYELDEKVCTTPHFEMNKNSHNYNKNELQVYKSLKYISSMSSQH